MRHPGLGRVIQHRGDRRAIRLVAVGGGQLVHAFRRQGLHRHPQRRPRLVADLRRRPAEFKKGETFSKIFKGIHDLELKYGDTGAFFRGKYWYDFELKDEHRLLYDIDDHNRKEGAKSSGAQLLDAFLYHNYSIGDLPGSVRVGKQVVSWGESTFIQNSINSINPMDVAAFRGPARRSRKA